MWSIISTSVELSGTSCAVDSRVSFILSSSSSTYITSQLSGRNPAARSAFPHASLGSKNIARRMPSSETRFVQSGCTEQLVFN